MLEAKRILITGGTGSFGHALVSSLISKSRSNEIIIYSRDEMKQWDMQNRYKQTNIKFVIGDIRDCERLTDSMKNVDLVVHAAATKIVPTAEINPEECIKTNINGAMNVIRAAKANRVQKGVALSTDKASNPINLYGATKLASDKLFIAANDDTDPYETKFSVVRYGNVMGSRGSVIPFFLKQKSNGVLTVTDKRMTRFMITLEQAVDLVNTAFEDMTGGELYVKKIPSMDIISIAESVCSTCEIEFIGIRDGEKLHEQMIGADDAPYTYEYDNYFKVLPSLNNWHTDVKKIGRGKLVKSDFTYSSDQNTEWMEVDTLKAWIDANKHKMLNI